MTQQVSMVEVFVPLLSQSNRVPLKAISIVGEIIALDARLRDYGGGLMKQDNLQEIIASLEDYEQLVQRTRTGVNAFLEVGDNLTLIELLSEVRGSLSELL